MQDLLCASCDPRLALFCAYSRPPYSIHASNNLNTLFLSSYCVKIGLVLELICKGLHKLPPVALSHVCILTRWGQETWPNLDWLLQNCPPSPTWIFQHFTPPPTVVSPASLPTVPPLLRFSFLCSDVLPARLLSLLTTLPETQTDRHTYAHTHSAVPHTSIHQRQHCMCWKEHMSRWDRI